MNLGKLVSLEEKTILPQSQPANFYSSALICSHLKPQEAKFRIKLKIKNVYVNTV